MSKWKSITDVVKSGRDEIRSGDSLPSERIATEAVAAGLPANITRDQVFKLEEKLRALPSIIDQTQTLHHFCDGLYLREWRQPAGTIVIGKQHRKAHMLLITAGEVTMLLETGVKRVSAPYIEVATAGIKRPVVAHTDTVILTVHPNPNNWGSGDLDKLEAELIVDPDSVVLDIPTA